ncbi:MAG: amidase domain-containing protein [Bacteroides sp.]|nr:amidase domain-containing protein [Eubacterium sp.]MCM1419554.1 amidase domain-containing protein [Roseburia sp.]MCM1461503.1 amidase domain-containing protein [Bacteroides sp.]
MLRYKTKALLTTLIVLTVTAIVIVGFVLAWDLFDLEGKLDAFFDTDLYGSDEPLIRSDTVVTVLSPNGGGLPEAERLVLERFFTAYFASLGSFYHENISRYYASECEDELIDDLALTYEIDAAKSAGANLSFGECTVRFTVLTRRSIERESPNTAELTVRLSAEIPYAFSKEAAQITEETHTFRLKTEREEALITAHSSDHAARTAALAALDELLAAVGFTRADLTYSYYAPYLARAAETLAARLDAYRETVLSSFAEEYIPVFTAEYDYDRAAATDYARGASHSAEYGDYEENDANFCSQCLAAGGIPMDAQGDKLTQWKWYGYEENNARENSGCTRSWYERERFWVYATENTGFGLVAEPSAVGEAGDVIQLLDGDGETPILSAVILAPIYDKSGAAVDYLICTDRLKSVPLSLVRAGDFRVLHIIGYNTANI